MIEFLIYYLFVGALIVFSTLWLALDKGIINRSDIPWGEVLVAALLWPYLLLKAVLEIKKYFK